MPCHPTAYPSNAGAAPQAFLAGVGHEAVTATHAGSQVALEVQLSPLASLPLFGVPGSELGDLVMDLTDLWGRTGAELVERAATAATWQERLDLLDAAFFNRKDRGRQVDPVTAGGS